MQKGHLTISEIIWEITGTCNNHCDYCGSKEGWNGYINEATIRKIIDRIVEYGGCENLDISGGDPLLVRYETHQYLFRELREIVTNIKILCNPKSLQIDTNHKIDILKHYDWIGVSINNDEELNLFLKYRLNIPQKITVITNFNIQNVFLFNKIKEVVKQFGYGWQIQFTMYKHKDHALALYKNNNACDHLFSLIQAAMNEDIKIICADNMNNGSCGAGSCSLGILSNGDVIPCLSMQSWYLGDINHLAEGNLINESLEMIWNNGFEDYRFGYFTCCKDCTNKVFSPVVKQIIPSEYTWIDMKDKKLSPFVVQMYAVQPYEHTTVYAVQPLKPTIVYGVRPHIMAYAVIPVDNSEDITSTTYV